MRKVTDVSTEEMDCPVKVVERFVELERVKGRFNAF